MDRRKYDILTIVLIVFLVVNLTACSQVEESKKTPEETVVATLDAIKAGEVSAVSMYMNFNKLVEKTGTEDMEEDIDEIFFANLEYELLSSSEKGDQATVVAKITNIDMSLLMDELFETAMRAMANAPVETEEELDLLLLRIYTDFLRREDNETMTKVVEIPLYYDGEDWKINFNEEFTDIILGGMFEGSTGLDGN